jgi:hypothetical protein
MLFAEEFARTYVLPRMSQTHIRNDGITHVEVNIVQQLKKKSSNLTQPSTLFTLQQTS